MDWTRQQREAIEYRGRNILLAAAAGSGKTTVLVQRIIELISGSNDTDAADISELLVLTFTDAAASEMRGKIASAVSTALDENPEDEHMQRQRLLMHSSSISTIHSFCMNIIKSNIHMTKLPVNFGLASETENSIMMNEAVDEVLERFYSRIDKNSAFKRLVLGYGGKKNDENLRTTILSLLRFSKSMAYPSRWLCDAVRAYRRTAESGVLDSEWRESLDTLFDEGCAEISEIYELILREIDERLYPEHPYAAFFADEEVTVRTILEGLRTANYDERREKLLNFSFPRMKAGERGAEGETHAAQECVKQYRNFAKDCVKELAELYSCEMQVVVDRICKTYPVVRSLKNLVLTVDRRYTRKKREKNLLDFSDLEHEALALLVGADGKATETALALKEKYREILVDEYQDTNNIQDTIFRAVSRDNKNIFMVGDIKQSIYKFRNASPALFLEKYRDYGADDSVGHLIRLFMNFRSRQEIVNTVNYIFRRIMSEKIGELDYTDEEYLIYGATTYPETAQGFADTELHMIGTDAVESSELADTETVELDKYELEARAAANRIRELIGDGCEVYDAKRKALRPIKYSDIVILMRNTKSAAPVFEQVLSEYGIAAYTDVGRSYLGSVEVGTVLSYLQIIDNSRQDIPLIAVLRSPMWGFSADELAQMRINMRGGCFYDALSVSAESGNARAKEFMESLASLRKRAKYESVCDLVWSIYYDLGYYAYVGAIARGAERQANLRLLYERAADFEHTKLSGLSGFMSYIDMLRQEKEDMTPAKIFGEGENVVRIMSIHKSKGLEFPVVILADTAHKFNMTDLNRSIIHHEKYGIAAEYVDTERRVRYPSLPRTIMAVRSKREMLSEEMRLLYVALTRAREKLIILASFSVREKSWRKSAAGKGGRVLTTNIRRATSFRDWLCAALISHPSAEVLREICGAENRCVTDGADFGLKVIIHSTVSEPPTAECAESSVEKKEETERDAVTVKARIEYEYPNRVLGDIPVKMSVSEVKRTLGNDENIPVLEELRNTDLTRLDRLSSAERGTVTHFVMQAADSISTVADAETLLDRLVKDSAITRKMAECVDTAAIAEFFSGELGGRMKDAARVEREFSFYTEDTADAIFKNGVTKKILLQGTIDCFFVENDGTVVLLDYKTDRVRNRDEALRAAEKYRVQMKYYKKGLSEILGSSVDECYVYFLECGEAVKM